MPKIRKKFPSVFARRLIELRRGRQLTQEELAEKLARTAINKMESEQKSQAVLQSIM